jgi:hypothetical protein
MIAGVPWWLNWFVIYPGIAVGVLMAAAMVGLMVFGLTVVIRSDNDD